MITLAKVTRLTRGLLKWGAILVVALIVFNILFKIGLNIRNKYFPPAPPPPTVLFGKLPQPSFPKSAVSKKLNFTIDTLTGVLPKFPSQIKVYKTLENQPGLLSLQKARERVARLGFKTGERQITTRVYQWTNSSGRTIKLDTISYDFDVTSNFYKDPKVLEAKFLPDPKITPDIAKGFLSALDLSLEDLDIEKSKITFFKIADNVLHESTSLSDSQIIRVDLGQKPIEDIPIVYPDRNTTLVNFLIAGTSEDNIVEAHFFYRPVNKDFSTYPIKTVQSALDDLKDGKAYILSLNDKSKNDVNIKKVFLAYYMSPKTSQFLYPVYVFEGDNGFTAYVWAIDSAFIESGQSSQ